MSERLPSNVSYEDIDFVLTNLTNLIRPISEAMEEIETKFKPLLKHGAPGSCHPNV